MVSSRLGQKGVAITLDTYTAVTPEQDRAAPNRVNGRLTSLLQRAESSAADVSQTA